MFIGALDFVTRFFLYHYLSSVCGKPLTLYPPQKAFRCNAVKNAKLCGSGEIASATKPLSVGSVPTLPSCYDPPTQSDISIFDLTTTSTEYIPPTPLLQSSKIRLEYPRVLVHHDFTKRRPDTSSRRPPTRSRDLCQQPLRQPPRTARRPEPWRASMPMSTSRCRGRTGTMTV